MDQPRPRHMLTIRSFLIAIAFIALIFALIHQGYRAAEREADLERQVRKEAWLRAQEQALGRKEILAESAGRERALKRQIEELERRLKTAELIGSVRAVTAEIENEEEAKRRTQP